MDEVFDEDCDDIEISRREWSRLQENRIKEGYKQGLTAGEESKLQEGFDSGYKHSVSQAYQLARMRGILCAILVKLHQDDQTASGEDTQLTKELVEEISDIEKDILQQIQSPVTDGTGLPGPSMAVLCCAGVGDNGKPCACSSNHREVTDTQNAGESVVPSSDKNLNHGDSDCPGRNAGESTAFSNQIIRVKQEVVSLMKRMDFSDQFIATL